MLHRMIMMSCREVCDHASDFIEAELPLRSRLRLGLHLLICRHCARFMRYLRLAGRVSAAIDTPEPPDDAAIDALIQKLLTPGRR